MSTLAVSMQIKNADHVFSKDATISYIIFTTIDVFPAYATQQRCKMLIQGRIRY